MEITITVKDKTRGIAFSRTALTWESAEENLGKLERAYDAEVAASQPSDTDF